MTAERVFICTPPPHFSEHTLYADQPETLQSIGHSKVLQSKVRVTTGHVMPP